MYLVRIETDILKLYEYKEGVQKLFNDWIQDKRNEYSKIDQYDYNKTPIENSRTQRNNMLITLIQARLTDPETIKDRYTPGGFSNASRAAKKIRFLLIGNKETQIIYMIRVIITLFKFRRYNGFSRRSRTRL